MIPSLQRKLAVIPSGDGNAGPVLSEFVTMFRDAIIIRTREKLTNRPWPLASTSDLEYGVPLFLTQLAHTLDLETAKAENGF